MIPKPYIAKWQEQYQGFTGDMEALLRTGVKFNQEEAFNWLKSELINKI